MIASSWMKESGAHRKEENNMKAEAMIENLKKRVAFYKRDLVSFDELVGYMQALHDIGLLEADDITLIVSDLINWRYRHEGKYED